MMLVYDAGYDAHCYAVILEHPAGWNSNILTQYLNSTTRHGCNLNAARSCLSSPDLALSAVNKGGHDMWQWIRSAITAVDEGI